MGPSPSEPDSSPDDASASAGGALRLDAAAGADLRAFLDSCLEVEAVARGAFLPEVRAGVLTSSTACGGGDKWGSARRADPAPRMLAVPARTHLLGLLLLLHRLLLLGGRCHG